jgi:hypothetical protein
MTHMSGMAGVKYNGKEIIYLRNSENKTLKP